MGLLSFAARLLNRGKTDPQSVARSRIVATPRTSAGVWVDSDTALRNATVWACVNYLARTVAQLPWRAMREGARGSEIVASNPVDYLIHSRPNPEMGSFSFRQTLLTHALLWGNGYAEIQRDARGAAFALWPIRPDRVVVRRSEAGDLEYEVWNARGGSVVVPAADMFHVRGFGDGPVGFSVIEYAAQSIGWSLATELFAATYFGEGMNPSGIVEVPSELKLSSDAFAKLRAEIDTLYKGPKGKRTLILDGGMKFQRLATTPEDSQFIETRQHQVEEICRWFGVPPHKVMHLLRATFSNIEHQSIEVVVDSITPWVKIFEEEADYKLFGANRANFFTKMNLRGLLRGDNTSRAQFYKALFEMGALSPNEIRAFEDMNGQGADGDRYFVSNNVKTLDAAIAEPPASEPSTTDLPALPARSNGAANGRRLQH